MSNVTIQKRGKYYQYKFEVAKVDGYRLSSLTSVKLNSFIVELCNKYNFKKAYYNNILKVLKNCFRIATDVYGFIRYNPALTLKLPKIEDDNDFQKHLLIKMKLIQF